MTIDQVATDVGRVSTVVTPVTKSNTIDLRYVSNSYSYPNYGSGIYYLLVEMVFHFIERFVHFIQQHYDH